MLMFQRIGIMSARHLTGTHTAGGKFHGKDGGIIWTGKTGVQTIGHRSRGRIACISREICVNKTSMNVRCWTGLINWGAGADTFENWRARGRKCLSVPCVCVCTNFCLPLLNKKHTRKWIIVISLVNGAFLFVIFGMDGWMDDCVGRKRIHGKMSIWKKWSRCVEFEGPKTADTRPIVLCACLVGEKGGNSGERNAPWYFWRNKRRWTGREEQGVIVIADRDLIGCSHH